MNFALSQASSAFECSGSRLLLPGKQQTWNTLILLHRICIEFCVQGHRIILCLYYKKRKKKWIHLRPIMSYSLGSLISVQFLRPSSLILLTRLVYFSLCWLENALHLLENVLHCLDLEEWGISSKLALKIWMFVQIKKKKSITDSTWFFQKMGNQVHLMEEKES